MSKNTIDDYTIGDLVVVDKDARSIGEIGWYGVVTEVPPSPEGNVKVLVEGHKWPLGYAPTSLTITKSARLDPVKELQDENNALQMAIDEFNELAGEQEERIAFLEHTLRIAHEQILGLQEDNKSLRTTITALNNQLALIRDLWEIRKAWSG
jgi:hypothetical protein